MYLKFYLFKIHKVKDLLLCLKILHIEKFIFLTYFTTNIVLSSIKSKLHDPFYRFQYLKGKKPIKYTYKFVKYRK